MQSLLHIYQLLDDVEKNIATCQWRADFAIAELNNCFIIRSPSLLHAFLVLSLFFFLFD